jgi:hypothetical protein
MKTIPRSRREHHLIKVCVFLITAALIAGMVGCDGDGYTPSQNLEIRTWYDLNATRDNLAGNHILMNDLNSTTPGYDELASPTANGGKGWQPIGWGAWTTGPYLFGEIFTGSFDGQGYEIRDLFINRSSWGGIGLFGCVGKGGIVKNISVINATVIVPEDVYGLVRFNAGTVGILDVATISAVGILVGFSMGSVSDSYASGTVSGDVCVGGLVGQNTGTVNNSYSTGNVTGIGGVGGLVGINGALIYGGTVSNSYSSGSVTGRDDVGGLVGMNEGSGAGVDFHGTVSNSFWDTQTSGQATSAGGTGKTTTEMQDIATFSGAGWNIIAVALNETNPAYIWNIVDNVTYPFLSWQGVSGVKYDLTMAVAPGGSGTATDLTNASPYVAGTEVSIKAVAAEGYRFISWTAPAGTFADASVGETTYTMPAQNVTVTANFAPFPGGSGTEGEPYQIADWYQLDEVRNYLDSCFILVNDLDSGTAGYTELVSPTANGGKGWQPIGSTFGNDAFVGSFDGQSYEIRDLFISRPGETCVGLFGVVSETGVVENLGVVKSNVNGGISVGGLVGANLGTVSNSYATGNMTASLTCCVGGLIGWTAGIVNNSYSTGTVTGDHSVGGLVGYNGGTDFAATVNGSYSTGTVTGSEYVGGLVGFNMEGCTVSNSYSAGNVTGDVNVGGLVGLNEGTGTVSNSFWDIETSGQATSAGGTGKNTTEMQDITTFLGVAWDIVAVALNETNPAYIWNIVDNVTYPFLSWQPV